MPHVLRANADPNQAYIDGRVGDLMNVIEGIGAHLRMHQPDAWHHLNSMTLAIFQAQEDDMVNKMKAYQTMLQEQSTK